MITDDACTPISKTKLTIINKQKGNKTMKNEITVACCSINNITKRWSSTLFTEKEATLLSTTKVAFKRPIARPKNELHLGQSRGKKASECKTWKNYRVNQYHS